MSSYRNEGSENMNGEFKQMNSWSNSKGHFDVGFMMSQNVQNGAAMGSDRMQGIGSF